MARRRYLDCARGIAVLVMILAHTLDAWTADPDRQSIAYRNLIILSGFAAPLFLLLAGVGVVLAAGKVPRTSFIATSGGVIVRRGLHVFALALLFRLQAFIVSPGSQPITLLRVDILNVMGLAMLAVGCLWLANRRKGALVAGCVAATIAVGLATPLVRTAAWVDGLPFLMQWYLRPHGAHTTFTLFPWAGFVFAGAAWGVLIAASHHPGVESRLHGWRAAAGAGMVALGFYAASRPSPYASSSFWTSSPSFFVLRIGVLVVAVAGYTAPCGWLKDADGPSRPLNAWAGYRCSCTGSMSSSYTATQRG